jgi:hypothetical protein
MYTNQTVKFASRQSLNSSRERYRKRSFGVRVVRNRIFVIHCWLTIRHQITKSLDPAQHVFDREAAKARSPQRYLQKQHRHPSLLLDPLQKHTFTWTVPLIRCRDNLSPTLWTWITSRSRREAAEAVAVEVEVVEATSKATHMVVDLPQRQ